MNTVIDKEFVKYAESKMAREVIRFARRPLTEKESKMLAHQIVEKIDWDNPTLMHKGFSWMAKNYLSRMTY